MDEIIITSGKRYTDIDGLSCALALRDLLVLEGKNAETVLTGKLNHSVTNNLKKLGLSFRSKFTDKDKETKLILVDVSELDQIPLSVDIEKVREVYDHHVGSKKFWKEKIGDEAKIEPLGACATLIWEEYKKRGMAGKISPKNAELLMMAIVSNTLNFNASITNQRDRKAFRELGKYASLNKNQIAKYFSEQAELIENDVKKGINNETKVQKIFNTNQVLVIGQLELWDGKNFIKKYLKEIDEVLSSFKNPDYFMNVPSISEGKNYIYAKSAVVKEMLTKAIGAKFEGDSAVTPNLWLRKEILERIYQLNEQVK
jgi:inorganic pyrophosphatase/exopolyphosphatase